MNWIKRCGSGILALSLMALPSCQKKPDAAENALQDAGYELTPEHWFRAARANDAQAGKKFVASGFDVATPQASGDQALHLAAESGSLEFASFLLDQGVAVDVLGAQQRTPLMAAVIADQTPAVRWLLQQGADPKRKDADGYMPIMLAVREGRPHSVAELAAYNREDLDSALLLASLQGQTKAIDALTNYGASIYARMEDGRTPLMLAAQNGHSVAVELLLDLGASRYATDNAGLTAMELANAAGYPELETRIATATDIDLSLNSSQQLAETMDAEMDLQTAGDTAVALTNDETVPLDEALSSTEIARAELKPQPIRPSERPTPEAETSSREPRTAGAAPKPSQASAKQPARILDGATLSRAIVPKSPSATPPERANAPADPAEPHHDIASATFPMPPLAMRLYRQPEMPIVVHETRGHTAVLQLQGANPRQVEISEGSQIPGSHLRVTRISRRAATGKDGDAANEIHVVQVKDLETGETREWFSGRPATSHDPVALLEDTATGQRYLAMPGQQFFAADGPQFTVIDVRPNQIIIEDRESGEVRTLPLRGPKG